MRTLELKDIAGYLPYGLNLRVVEDDEMHDGEFNGIDNSLNISITCGMYCAYGRVEDKNITPFLRPMPDLTKEITHKGKTFVPIVELAKASWGEGDWSVKASDEDIYQCEVNGVYFGWIAEDRIFATATPLTTDTMILNNQIGLFDLLNEWLFDYRGLIAEGLAIDVNTLEDNPYER